MSSIQTAMGMPPLERLAARDRTGPEGFRRLLAGSVPLLAFLALLPAASAQPVPSRDGPSVYTVMLDAPSVGERLSRSLADGGDGPRPRSASSVGLLRRAVARTQDPVIQDLESRGLEVVGSVRNVLNAVFVRATSDQADEIASLPGVAGLTAGRRYEPSLGKVSEIVGVPAVRALPAETQLRGEGIKIGIIDSGLDFSHEAFRDESLTPLPGYPRGDPKHLSLASTKVVAVRSYVESLNSKGVQSSTPDDYSPWDPAGHGTAVAMIAAGREVDGPLGPISGIAPKARIGVYKVFGTPGLNFYTADHAVVMAIEDAVSDGMDVLNLSLGHPVYYPSGWDCRGLRTARCDPLATAAQNAAVNFGKVVVVAAGNRGGMGLYSILSPTTINSPGTAPAVLTVGSTANAVRLEESVRVGARTFRALSGSGPHAAGPLAAPAVLAPDVGDPLGCAPFPAGAFLGRIAVIDRSECFFVEKVEHADAAGAVGVLVINHEGDELVDMALLGDTDIPAFFVGLSDGVAIRQAISETHEPLTLDPTPIASDAEWEYVASKSSIGPTLSLHPKPDLVAPGEVVLTAAPRYNANGILYTPSGFRTEGGTSLAAPVVAGAAALVWQAFPTLGARQVGSALVNSARPLLLEDGKAWPLVLSGAGLLDIPAALQFDAVVVPASIGFGSIPNSPFPIRRTLAVSNKSGRHQQFTLTVEPRDVDPRARVTVNGRTSAAFGVGPDRTARIQVALTGPRPLPGAYEGRLRLASRDGQRAAFIPYLYIVGDGEPFDALRFRGRSDVGIAGQAATKTLLARVLDQHGVPVEGRRVSFQPLEGEPRILDTWTMSGEGGLIYASVRYAGEPGLQAVRATIGDLEIPFAFEASASSPRVSSVANSASLSSPSGVAAGSLVALAGSGFAAFHSGEASPPLPPRMPVSRKGVQVAFDAPDDGVSAAGRIHSVGPETVTVQVPWELAGVRRAYVSVTSGNRSDPFEIEIAEVDPGIFSYESGGRFFAVAHLPDGNLVTPESPARRGQAVTIAMTGNGPVIVPVPTGAVPETLVRTVNRPQVLIAGSPAQVISSGLATEAAGVYTVTAVVPASAAAGALPLHVRVGGASSNAVLLPVR